MTLLPPDLAVMLVAMASRQATSPTARVQSSAAPLPTQELLLAPSSGAFNGAVATMIVAWKQE